MTTEKYAISGLTNVLYIDLSSQSYHIEERRDLYEKYLGGVLELLQTSCLKSIKKEQVLLTLKCQ